MFKSRLVWLILLVLAFFAASLMTQSLGNAVFGQPFPTVTPRTPTQPFPTVTLGSGQQTPQFPFVTPIPSITLDPNITYVAPTATLAGCPTPQNFTLGDTVVLIPGISVRYAPSPDSPLIITYADRREFVIVDGPVCVDSFIWWGIRGHGITGWAAEGRGPRYWLRFVSDSPDDPIACFPPLDLTVGERFELVFNVRIRAEPDIDALTRTIVSAGDSVIILGGSTCADGYNWWRVRATVLGVVYDGWMAEADRFGEEFVNVPRPAPCDFPLNFIPGDRVAVTYDDSVPKRLRSAPSVNAPILFDLLQQTPLIIVSGPVCVDSYNWWQVRVLASNEVTGWIAEGGHAQYWLRMVAPVPRTLTPTPTF